VRTTNERGVDGRIRYLRNVMGMWLVSECVNAWKRSRPRIDLDQLIAAAEKANRWAVFDVDDPALLPADDMPPRITALLASEGLREPNQAETVRSILESLAVAVSSPRCRPRGRQPRRDLPRHWHHLRPSDAHRSMSRSIASG
jgi:rhamnulokinase